MVKLTPNLIVLVIILICLLALGISFFREYPGTPPGTYYAISNINLSELPIPLSREVPFALSPEKMEIEINESKQFKVYFYNDKSYDVPMILKILTEAGEQLEKCSLGCKEIKVGDVTLDIYSPERTSIIQSNKAAYWRLFIKPTKSENTGLDNISITAMIQCDTNNINKSFKQECEDIKWKVNLPILIQK